MPEKVSMRQKRREAPEWIFPWKGRSEPLWPKLFAITFAALVCTALIGFVRIRTTTPDPWGLDKASVIHVRDTPEGRALALTARENGPSPARFETSDWPQLVHYQAEQLAQVFQPEITYQPQLREWQEPPHSLPPIWNSDTGVLPSTPPAPDPPEIPAAGKPHPVILPLSGITSEEIPNSLPRYTGSTDTAMLSGSVRFLLQLDPSGHVTDCIAIAGGDTTDATRELELWLRAVTFPRKPDAAAGWIAIRIAFLNQAS